MTGFLIFALLLVPMRAGTTWSSKYAVDCPESCDSSECKSTLHCKRTVLDDCGCCRVCPAALGETCYRTVSGMDGVKCGPGLKCQFYSEEDDFGDEFGICKGKYWSLNNICVMEIMLMLQDSGRIALRNVQKHHPPKKKI